MCCIGHNKMSTLSHTLLIQTLQRRHVFANEARGHFDKIKACFVTCSGSAISDYNRGCQYTLCITCTHLHTQSHTYITHTQHTWACVHVHPYTEVHAWSNLQPAPTKPSRISTIGCETCLKHVYLWFLYPAFLPICANVPSSSSNRCNCTKDLLTFCNFLCFSL